MTVITPDNIESMDGFQNVDDCRDWLDHEPNFEWTDEDYEEFEWDQRVEENERLAMAAWWDMEGVRCATFGRDPKKNPYR